MGSKVEIAVIVVLVVLMVLMLWFNIMGGG
jgi:hypothetical protein